MKRPEAVGFSHDSTTYQLDELGQVTWPLYSSVPSSIKWDDIVNPASNQYVLVSFSHIHVINMQLIYLYIFILAQDPVLKAPGDYWSESIASPARGPSRCSSS